MEIISAFHIFAFLAVGKIQEKIIDRGIKIVTQPLI